ncbi:MAG: response regulator transcription factor [Anaerolineaceae bacterium]|nr:response regulator transcription factor [Anaerolineaceae bacterium]MCY4022464.1 response regulator transcription factor [Anaerolineaceae bacterium]
MPSVLIVEDEEVLLRNLEARLRDDGFQVSTASDGEEAMAYIRATPPDLVVLDIMLPKLDGLSVCRMLRKDDSLANLPIIMLTARGTEVDRIVGLESGADDYIVKPFSLGEFLARVRAVLRRSPGHQPPQEKLLADDLSLDLKGHKLFCGGAEVHLSNREFMLLAELMRNSGAVLTRDLLLTRVWGEDNFVEKRTVDVHVRWLREKIEKDPSQPRRIVTVRGVGYRFEG